MRKPLAATHNKARSQAVAVNQRLDGRAPKPRKTMTGTAKPGWHGFYTSAGATADCFTLPIGVTEDEVYILTVGFALKLGFY